MNNLSEPRTSANLLHHVKSQALLKRLTLVSKVGLHYNIALVVALIRDWVHQFQFAKHAKGGVADGSKYHWLEVCHP